MESGMERISDKQLNSILRGMKETAPEGFSHRLMQKVRINKPRRSPLMWLIPLSGAMVAVLVLFVSINMFSHPNAGMVYNDTRSDNSISTEKRALPESDEGVFDNEAMSVAVSSPTTETLDAPIGGYTVSPPGNTEVSSLQSRLSTNRNMTASLVSGIINEDHLNTVLNSLKDFGNPYTRTDSYGNFLIDMGIHFDRIEEFDKTIHALLDELSDDDQGSMLIRVTAVR